MVVPLSNGPLDSSGAYYSEYSDIGSGTAFVFQDGVVFQASWAKSSPSAQLTFSDVNGSPLRLNPGQTWITAIANTDQLNYSL